MTFDGRTFSGHCVGEASDGPTVILESGSRGSQSALFNIEAQLSARTMVCAYERAGIGGSDPPPEIPRPVTDLVSACTGS